MNNSVLAKRWIVFLSACISITWPIYFDFDRADDLSDVVSLATSLDYDSIIYFIVLVILFFVLNKIFSWLLGHDSNLSKLDSRSDKSKNIYTNRNKVKSEKEVSSSTGGSTQSAGERRAMPKWQGYSILLAVMVFLNWVFLQFASNYLKTESYNVILYLYIIEAVRYVILVSGYLYVKKSSRFYVAKTIARNGITELLVLALIIYIPFKYIFEYSFPENEIQKEGSASYSSQPSDLKYRGLKVTTDISSKISPWSFLGSYVGSHNWSINTGGFVVTYVEKEDLYLKMYVKPIYENPKKVIVSIDSSEIGVASLEDNHYKLLVSALKASDTIKLLKKGLKVTFTLDDGRYYGQSLIGFTKAHDFIVTNTEYIYIK
jgi:hypothetical protein